MGPRNAAPYLEIIMFTVKKKFRGAPEGSAVETYIEGQKVSRKQLGGLVDTALSEKWIEPVKETRKKK